MIKIENIEVVGMEPAIRGMRNPMNSWDKSDSLFCKRTDCEYCECKEDCGSKTLDFDIGSNDYNLMMNLASFGSVHAKYRRMISVYLDITAPLYWWKEFDTYKVGTVANSCSTMHKIAKKEFTVDDFSHEHLMNMNNSESTDALFLENGMRFDSDYVLDLVIKTLNYYRQRYLHTKEKMYWWQMIQLLPSSYNQKRTIMLNYEVLSNIYASRKEHKLDEWREFCKWIESLPYSCIITLDKD